MQEATHRSIDKDTGEDEDQTQYQSLVYLAAHDPQEGQLHHCDEKHGGYLRNYENFQLNIIPRAHYNQDCDCKDGTNDKRAYGVSAY